MKKKQGGKDKKGRDQMREKDILADWLFEVGICNQICFMES